MQRKPDDPTESDSQPLEDDNPQYKATYAYLRAGVVVLVMMLAVGIVIDSSLNHGLRDSISAYFYGTANTVFVGALAGVGIAMLAYQGNLESEDHLLNFSGTLAFFVAMIPTPSDTSVDLNLIKTGVSAVLVASALAILVNWFVLKRFPFPKEELLAKLAATALGVWLIGYTALLLFWPTDLAQVGHPWAAIPMFMAIVLVAVLNALGTSERKFRTWYVAVAIVIPLGLLGVWGAVAWGGLRQGVFFAEAVVILAFAVFWVVQTIELTTKVRRAPKPPGASVTLDKLTSA